MKKLIIPILISFGLVFLMSHNSYAVSRTIYLKNGVYGYGIPADSGSQSGNSVTPQTGQQYNIDNNVYKLPNKIWYSLAWALESDNSYVDLSPYTDYTFSFSYCSAAPQYFIPSSNDLFRMTDYYESGGLLYHDFSGSNYSQQVPEAISGIINPSTNCSNVTMKGKVGTTSYNKFQLGTTANGSFTRIFSMARNDIGALYGSSELYIFSPTVVLFDTPNEAEQALDKEKQQAQDASNNSQSSGNSSQSSAQNATQSLLTTINNGIGVITSARATNCQINGNMGNLDLGNLDLCANPVPTFVQIILSLVAVVTVIPLAIVLFNRFIGIFRSFQG